MVTKEQAMTGQSFHYTGRHDCKRTVGPRGGITETVTRVRASGRCKTWVTRPTEFSLPIKCGMYESSYIDHTNAQDFHPASECPEGIW